MADTSVQSMPNGDLRAREFDEVNAHQLSLQWRYGLADYLKGTEPTTPPILDIHRTIPNGNEVNPTDGILPILYFPINQAIGNTSPPVWNPATPTTSLNTRRLYLYNGDSLNAPIKSGWWLTYGNKTNYRALPFGGDYMYSGTNYSNLPYATQRATYIGDDKTYTFLKYVGGSNITAYVGPRPTATIQEIQYASARNSLSVGAGLTSNQRNFVVFATNGGNKRYADDTSFQQPLPFKIYFCGYYTDLLSISSYNQLILFPGMYDYLQTSVNKRAAFTILPVNQQYFYYQDVRMGIVDAGLPAERFVMYFKMGTYNGWISPTQFIEYEVHFYKDKNYFDVHYISSGTPTSSVNGNGIYYSSTGVYVTDSNSIIHSGPNYPGPKYFIGDERAIRVTTSVNGYNAYSQGYELGKVVDSRYSVNSNNSLLEYQLQITNPMGYTFTDNIFGSNTTIYSINIVKNVGLASKVSTNDYQVTGELDEVNYDWSASPGVKTILTPQGNLYVNGQFDEVNLNT